jgi:putative ABC transport system permease protein
MLVLGILGSIPLLTGRLATLAETELMQRAASTPLVYGPPGSQLDLSLNSLFFEGEERAELTMEDYETLAQMYLGTVLPILRTHSARGFPVVGTDIEYFTFRNLEIAQGRPFVGLGEAVIGADLADKLGIVPGGMIQSDSKQVFELAGAYPVRMPVVGVLARTGTSDDRAVFVDLNTAWIVAGIGHGHEDLTTSKDESVLLSKDDDRIVANAKLTEYIEISPKDADAFHLHGDPSKFPLTALLIAPIDDRSAAIIRGRVEDQGSRRQIFRPTAVISNLLDEVFRVKSILDLLVAAVTFAALLALGMMIALSMKLRRAEFELVHQLGGDRSAMTRIVLAELALILMASCALCAILLVSVIFNGEWIIRTLVFGG